MLLYLINVIITLAYSNIDVDFFPPSVYDSSNKLKRQEYNNATR